jgi:hypothetical protein
MTWMGMEQLELPLPSMLVDGMRDSRDEGIEYWGRATLQWDGTWRCYANVHGALCIVEVNLKLGPEGDWCAKS